MLQGDLPSGVTLEFPGRAQKKKGTNPMSLSNRYLLMVLTWQSFWLSAVEFRDWNKTGRSSPQGLPEGQLHREKEKSSDLHFIVEMGGAQSIDKVQTQNELRTLLLSNIKFWCKSDSEALKKAKFLRKKLCRSQRDLASLMTSLKNKAFVYGNGLNQILGDDILTKVK